MAATRARRTAPKRPRAGQKTSRRPRPGTPERRHSRRQAVDLLVNRFLDGYPYLCRATDISRSGMCVRPLLGPTASGWMGLQFQLPGCDDVLTASGEAVFVAGEGGPMGIRFTRVPSGTAASIDRFLAVRRT
jgi:hypothetical protein